MAYFKLGWLKHILADGSSEDLVPTLPKAPTEFILSENLTTDILREGIIFHINKVVGATFNPYPQDTMSNNPLEDMYTTMYEELVALGWGAYLDFELIERLIKKLDEIRARYLLNGSQIEDAWEINESLKTFFKDIRGKYTLPLEQ